MQQFRAFSCFHQLLLFALRYTVGHLFALLLFHAYHLIIFPAGFALLVFLSVFCFSVWHFPCLFIAKKLKNNARYCSCFLVARYIFISSAKECATAAVEMELRHWH